MAGNRRLQEKRTRHNQKRKEKRAASSAASQRALSGSARLIDRTRWPVLRAYVPESDVWRATGYATVGVIRGRPDGRCASAFFLISLSDRGLKGVFGKDDTTLDEMDELLRDLGHEIPPTQIGELELAAQIAWGAWALAEREGRGFPPRELASYLALLPRPAGSQDQWIHRLVGAGGSLCSGAWEPILVHNPDPDSIPEDKEAVIFTEATFDLDDPQAACRDLQALAPAFVTEAIEEGVHRFSWTRPYPRRHWSPLSRLGGRQVIGSVKVGPATVTAEAMNLSFAGSLIRTLKETLTQKLQMRDVQWRGVRDGVADAARVTGTSATARAS